MVKYKWIWLAGAVVIALAVGSLGTRWFYDWTGQANAAANEIDPTAPAKLGPSSISTDSIINNLTSYLKTHPRDSIASSNLGIVYLQKARESGDPAYYTLADQVLHHALDLDLQNYRTLSGLGSLALSRHQFREALDWGERARAFNPDSAGVYGIIGDAHIELGEYDQAFAAFDQMTALRPDLSSYSRVSYARELTGNLAGAVEAMQAAVKADAPDSEGANWARVQLGNLYFNQGDMDQGAQAYNEALSYRPDYPYALAGLGNVRAAAGDYGEAITLYAHAIDAMPLPQFVIALGDLYAAAGRPKDAAREYDLVDAEARLFQANGVEMDAEIALFDADHHRNLASNVQQARTAFAQRPSITVADILAWTLYQAGDYQQAQAMMARAFALGTQNALMDYHAGMIAYALGDDVRAADDLSNALALNPHFSLLYADSARKLLTEIQSGAGNEDIVPVSVERLHQ